MTIVEIKEVIDSKKYKSYKLGYREYYIMYHKNYSTYVSYIGIFETITYKINKFFKDFRIGIFYNDKTYVEEISNFHRNDYLSNSIGINPQDLYEIVSGEKIEIFFKKNEKENNNYKVNEQLFYIDLKSNIRKNKLLKIANDNRRNIK